MAGSPEKIRCTDVDSVGNRKGVDRFSCCVEVIQFRRDGKSSSINLNLQVCVVRCGLSQGLSLLGIKDEWVARFRPEWGTTRESLSNLGRYGRGNILRELTGRHWNGNCVTVARQNAFVVVLDR